MPASYTAADGTIYFANPSNSSKLYSMNSDGSDLTKISDDVATFINADDNYIYYVRNNPVFTEPFSFLTINTDSLCRLNHDKHKKSILLDSSASLYASLVGNKIYFSLTMTTKTLPLSMKSASTGQTVIR